jgi:hypothetical protein
VGDCSEPTLLNAAHCTNDLLIIEAIIGKRFVIVTALPNLQVRDLASSYYSAAEVLDNAEANAIPIINLRCHAIELFLKSLHLKDTTEDIGNGVFLLRPISGRSVRHGLKDSFDKALQEHRDELLCGMPNLVADLIRLEGAFKRSRYIYEDDGSLPFSEAKSVSRYLAEKLPKLRLLAVSID